MTYKYELKLRLANAKRGISFKSKEKIIQKAIEIYNQRSFSMQNPKEIKINKIESEYLYIDLGSSLPLSSVGKALRTFSVIILKELEDPDFIKEVSSNGQLFSTTLISNDEIKNNKSVRNLAEVSDLDVIKSLMDYVYKKKDPDSSTYRKKRAAMTQIKQIAIESGILDYEAKK